MKITKFENAYGIKEVKLRNIDKLSNVCIYASNGTFKSSFTNAIYNLTQMDGRKNISDRINKLEFSYNIKFNNEDYSNLDEKLLENVIVYSKDIFEEKNLSKNSLVNRMLILPDAQEEMSTILDDVRKIKEDIIDKAKSIRIRDINSIEDIRSLIKSGSQNNIDILVDFFDNLEYIENLNLDFLDLSKINQKAYDIIDQKSFKKEVETYLDVVNKEFSNRVFDSNFNDTNYKKLIDEMERTKFLSTYRQLVIGKRTFEDIENFKIYLSQEIEKIKREPQVIKQYEKVVKILGTVKEADVVKEFIKSDSKMAVLSHGRHKIKYPRLKNSLMKGKFNN